MRLHPAALPRGADDLDPALPVRLEQEAPAFTAADLDLPLRYGLTPG